MLKLAEELGATHMIISKRNTDVVKTVRDLTCGGAKFAVDCTGIVPVIEMLIDCVGPRGVAGTVGVVPPGNKIQIDPLKFLLENKSILAWLKAT